MISADVKANIQQQEIKELMALSYKFLKERQLGIPSKLETQCKKDVHFSFSFFFFLIGIPSSLMIDFVHYEQGVRGG